MDAPKTKFEFYQRFLSGEFGNMYPGHIRSYEELLSLDPQPVEVSIRSFDKSFPTIYHVQTNDVYSHLHKFPNGYCLVAHEHVEPRRLIQGELSECPYLRLTYSTVNKVMKVALAEETRHADNLLAKEILKYYLNSNSYSDMMELLDLYPGAAIEFSTYERSFGTLPGRNTVIWEVRSY